MSDRRAAGAVEAILRWTATGHVDAERDTPEIDVPIADHITGFRLARAGMRAVEAGAIHIDDDARYHLGVRATDEQCVVDLALRTAHVATDALHDASLAAVVVKGVALAATTYPEGTRSFVDADILVGPDELTPAIAALEEVGFRRVGGHRHSEAAEVEFSKAVMMVHPDMAPVDLHRLPIKAPVGDRIATAFLTRTAPIDGLVVPDAAGLAVHAALSLVLGDRRPRPIQYGDVLSTVGRAGLEEVLARAAELDVRSLTAAAVDVAHQAVGLTGPTIDYTPTVRDLLTARAARSRSRLALDALWLADMRDFATRVRYLRYILGSSEYARSTRSRSAKMRSEVTRLTAPRPRSRRIDVCISNGRHHRGMVEGAIEQMARSGARVRVLSFCELRGEVTPTSLSTHATVRQIVPSLLGRLRARGGPAGGTGGASDPGSERSVGKRMVSRVVAWRVRLEWLRNRPDLVVTMNDAFFPLGDVAALATEMGVRTVLLQEGIRFDTAGDEAAGASYGGAVTDGVLTWGERSAQYFRSVRDTSADVEVVGHPKLRPRPVIQRAASDGRRLLLCSNPLSAFGFATEEEQHERLDAFLGSARSQGIDVLVRRHPQENACRFAALAAAHGAEIDTGPLEESFDSVDGVVVFASTVGIEALAAGRRLGVLELPRGGYAFDYVDAGIGVPIAGPDFKSLGALLQPPDPRWDQCRLKYLCSHLGPPDAAQRIADACARVADQAISANR